MPYKAKKTKQMPNSLAFPVVIDNRWDVKVSLKSRCGILCVLHFFLFIGTFTHHNTQ